MCHFDYEWVALETGEVLGRYSFTGSREYLQVFIETLEKAAGDIRQETEKDWRIIK